MKKIYTLFIVFAATFGNVQTNLINNGTFDKLDSGWSIFIAKSDSTGSISLAGGNATFTRATPYGNNWDNFGIY